MNGQEITSVLTSTRLGMLMQNEARNPRLVLTNHLTLYQMKSSYGLAIYIRTEGGSGYSDCWCFIFFSVHNSKSLLWDFREDGQSNKCEELRSYTCYRPGATCLPTSLRCGACLVLLILMHSSFKNVFCATVPKHIQYFTTRLLQSFASEFA